MRKLFLACGVLGLTGVALGAFGAHALKATLLERGMSSAWETAVHYHLIHAVALLAIVVGGERIGEGMRAQTWLCRAGWAWALGVILFSGSLYGLALGGPRLLGPVTPLGGLFLLTGWACLFFAGLSRSAEAKRN